MRVLSFGWIILSLIFLAGCPTDRSSPEGVMMMAEQALKASDAASFVETLTGTAAQNCGDLSGMMSLQNELRPFKNLKVSNPALVWIEKQGSTELYRLYEVTIQGQEPDLNYPLNWDVTIRCEPGKFYGMDCRIAMILGATCEHR